MILMLYLTRLVFAQEPTPTEVPATLTVLPTDEAMVTIEASVTPIPLEPSASPTLTPTIIPTLEATLIAATDMPPTQNLPTIQPTTPLFPTINLLPNAVRLPQKSILTLSVLVSNLTEVYGVALACHVDPAQLMGVQSTPGDLLQTDQSIVADSGFQPGGQWVLIERQMDGAPGLSSTGLLWQLNYQVVGVGLAQVLCQVQLFDRSSQPYGLPNAVFEVMIEGYAEAATLIPTVPVMALASATPLPTMTSTETMSPLLEATVAITPPLPTVQPTRIEPTFFPTVIPIHTDVDGNGTVEDADAALVIANFGLSVPPAPSSADVNHDGIVNIYDLTLISVKLRSSN